MAGFGDPAIGGAVEIIYDSEVPRSFTGYAKQVISGGQFVTGYAGATKNIIGSTTAAWSTGSVVIGLITDSDYAVGIAMANTASGAPIAVATRGQFIATAGGAISGGVGVYAVSGTIQYVAPIPITAMYSGTQVGRAITNADSGTNHFALVHFNF